MEQDGAVQTAHRREAIAGVARCASALHSRLLMVQVEQATVTEGGGKGLVFLCAQSRAVVG